MSAGPTQPGLFARPAVIRSLIGLLAVACAGLVAGEWFYPRHPHFGFDGWFGFYPGLGFLAYCVIVLAARALRPLLRRDENYYHDDDPTPAPPAAGDRRERDHD